MITEQILPGSIVLLAAACIQGITGFGISLLALPLLGMILGMREAVPVLVLLSIVTNLWVAKDHLDELRFKTILSILLPAVIGVPAGIWILSVISAGQLKTAAGVVIAAFALLAAADFSFMKKARIGRPYVFGFLSGVLNGSVSLSGPPIIAYFSMERLRKDSFRSNISAYFFLLNIVTLAGMIPAGLCGTDEVLASAGLLPALLLGTAAGVRISRHIDEVLFRRVTLGLLFILGASTVIL